MLAELSELATRRPWGHALMAVGGVHLAFFLVCQAVYTAGVRAAWPSLLLWSAELAAVLGVMRLVAGRHWLREAPAVGLIVRVWVTFLILSFNVVSLQSLTGWTVDWFKPVWCTLASFGFATMAWLFGLRFLVPAFQMYFTGLLMVRFPEWNYLIHGLSWCAGDSSGSAGTSPAAVLASCITRLPGPRTAPRPAPRTTRPAVRIWTTPPFRSPRGRGHNRGRQIDPP